MFRYYLKNMLLSPAFVIGITGLSLAMLAGADLYDDLLYSYQYAISIGVTSFFIPVASVLPVCYMQRQMNNGNVSLLCLIRSNRRSYSICPLFSASISGMAVMLGAFLLFTLFCAVYCPAPYFGNGLFTYTDNFYCFFSGYPHLMYLLMGVIFTLNGAIWPAVSLLCFSFTSNQYVPLAVPFVVRTGTGYLAQAFGWFYLDPSQLLLKGVANQLPGGGIPFLLSYSAVVILLCGVFWYCSVRRRLRNG